MNAKVWRLIGSCLIAAIAIVVLSVVLSPATEVSAAPNPPEGQVQALCASGAMTQSAVQQVVLATADVLTETVLVVDGSGSGCSVGRPYCTGAWVVNVQFATNYLRSVFGVTVTLGVYSDTAWFSEPTQEYESLIDILAGWPMPNVGDSNAALAMQEICAWGRPVNVLWLTDNGTNQSPVSRCGWIQRLDVLSPVGTPDVDVTGDADTSASCTSWPCFLGWAPAIEANGPDTPWVLEDWQLEQNCPVPTYRLWVGNFGGTMPQGVSDGNYVWMAGNGARAEVSQVVPATLTVVYTETSGGDYWGALKTEFDPAQRYMATQFAVTLRQVGPWVSQLQSVLDRQCPDMAQTAMHQVPWCEGYPVPIVTGPSTVSLASTHSWNASASLPPSHTTMWRRAYGPFNSSNWWEADWGIPCHSAQGDIWQYVSFPTPGLWTPHVWVSDTTNNLVTVEPFQVEVICTDPQLHTYGSSQGEVGRPLVTCASYEEGFHLDLRWDNSETGYCSTHVFTQAGVYTVVVTGTDACQNQWVASKTVTATINDYYLTVTTIGDGSVVANPANDAYHYGDIVTLTAAPDPGWSFAGWSGNASGSTNPTVLTMDADKSVTATFTQDEYHLDIATVGKGSVTVNPSKLTYTYGTVVTLTAVPARTWYFAGWSGDAFGTDNPVQITIDGDKVISATFKSHFYFFPFVRQD